jgi:site-specific DNA recombinase
MAVIGKDYLGCNYARRRATCTNKAAVRRSKIEELVLDGLKSQLMAPDLVKDFVQAFQKK